MGISEYLSTTESVRRPFLIFVLINCRKGTTEMAQVKLAQNNLAQQQFTNDPN